jgi:hypothetical protein
MADKYDLYINDMKETTDLSKIRKNARKFGIRGSRVRVVRNGKVLFKMENKKVSINELGL